MRSERERPRVQRAWHMQRQTGKPVWKGVEVRGQCQVSSSVTVLHVSRSLMNPELPDFSGLASQVAPRILIPIPQGLGSHVGLQAYLALTWVYMQTQNKT